MTSTLKRIKPGEYLYSMGGFSKKICRNAYNGRWDIHSAEWCGAPAFALGFASKKEAREWLDNNIDAPSE